MTVESQQQVTNDTNEISLKELILKIREWWRYLLSRWLIISIFGILGGVSGFVYAYLKKPLYRATTTFVLEDEKSSGGLSNLAGLASMAGVDLGGGGGGIFQGDNILQLYKSRTMIEKTLLSNIIEKNSKELLINRYIKFNNLKEKWLKKTELLTLSFYPDTLTIKDQNSKQIRLRDSILGEIVDDINKNYLTVSKPDKKLSIIQVDVTAKDELFAKMLNDQLVKNVNEFYINTKTKKTLQNTKILQHKTDSVRAVMNGAIYTAATVTDATPNLNPTRQVQRVAPVQKAQFSAETNKTILAEMVKNLEMTKLALLKETPLIQVVDKPIFPLKKDRVSKIKGVIFGGFLLGLMTVIFLVLKRVYDKAVISQGPQERR